MTVGYLTSGVSNTASGTYYEIRPPTASPSTEWIIHNIYCGASATIYFGSSTATTACVPVYSLSSSGWVTGIFAHVNSVTYLMVKNLGSASATFGFDGMVSRD